MLRAGRDARARRGSRDDDAAASSSRARRGGGGGAARRARARRAAGAARHARREQSSGSSNLFAMDQAAAQPVRRPPKPGARAVDDDRRARRRSSTRSAASADARSTSTSAARRTSPARSRRRCTATCMSLVEGGYSAQEILDAFVDTYGERALMAPKKEGFNWAGYLVPFVALGGGRRCAGRRVLRRMAAARERARRARDAARASTRHAPTSWRASTPRSADDDVIARARRSERCSPSARSRTCSIRCSSTRRRRARRRASRRATARTATSDAVVALREIEFDRATGKLSDADYAELKTRYTRAALERCGADALGAAAVGVQTPTTTSRRRCSRIARGSGAARAAGRGRSPTRCSARTAGRTSTRSAPAAARVVEEAGAAFCVELRTAARGVSCSEICAGDCAGPLHRSTASSRRFAIRIGMIVATTHSSRRQRRTRRPSPLATSASRTSFAER